MECESKLNPLADEFVPSLRRCLSASAPEFFPSSHRRRPIASQPQRSRAQTGSSHAVTLNQPDYIHYSSNRKNCAQFFSSSIFVLMIFIVLYSKLRRKMRRKNRQSREQFTSAISTLA